MKFKTHFILTLSVLSLLISNCKKKDKAQPEEVVQPTPPSPLATVITSPIINITDTTAVSGGTVTSEGTSAITAVGICWDTLSGPTTLKSKTINGAGTGNYISNLTGLKVNKKYYVRSYATNGNGTAYGNEISFLSPVYKPWVKSNSASAYTITCMLSNGASIYAGTTNGIIFSSDTGNTWVSKGLIGNYIKNIIQKNNTIFVATQGGSSLDVYRTTDNGTTWTPLSVKFPYTIRVYDVAFHNNKLIAGTDSSAFYSLDNGDNWTRTKSGLPSPTPMWGGGAVFFTASSGQQVYAFAAKFVGPSTEKWLYKYNDVSDNWSLLTTLSQQTYINNHKVSGNNVFTSYSYSSNYYVDISKDGGNTWSTVSNLNGANFAVEGSSVLLSSSTGSFSVSQDSGENWTNIKKIGLPSGNNASAFISNYYLWCNTSNGVYKYKHN